MNSIRHVTVGTLGQAIRTRRDELNLTQAQAAGLCNVGVRFFSEVENGKATAHLGLVIQVLNGLGLELEVVPRSWKP